MHHPNHFLNSASWPLGARSLEACSTALRSIVRTPSNVTRRSIGWGRGPNPTWVLRSSVTPSWVETADETMELLGTQPLSPPVIQISTLRYCVDCAITSAISRKSFLEQMMIAPDARSSAIPSSLDETATIAPRTPVVRKARTTFVPLPSGKS